MKRLFPRAVPEALFALLLVGGGCSPSSDVKPGAPVLTMLSIVDPSGTRLDITAAAAECAMGVKEGDSCDPAVDMLCHTAAFDWCNCVAVPEQPAPPCSADVPDAGAADGPAEGGAGDASSDTTANAATDAGADSAAADASEAGTGDASNSEAGDASNSEAGDAGAVAAPHGTWSCPAFSPLSKVVATFDRLLDTVPLAPADDKQSGRDDLASASVKTPVMPTPTTLTDYTPNGSTGGLIFKLFGENPGPNLRIVPQPAWPASNTITVALSKGRVLARKILGYLFTDQ